MKRPVQLGIASLKALGIVVIVGAAAHAGMPYLPLIGPPPLRLLAAKSPGTAVFKIEAPVPPVTNSPAVAAAKNFLAETNSASVVTPAVVAPLIGAGAEQSLGETFAGSVFELPTPDLLGLTPQMLATYFHPVQFGTNDAATGPFRVSFLPPLPPDRSSHAEYNVK
jgi:hypothetical protein